jgi:hypothetical protein
MSASDSEVVHDVVGEALAASYDTPILLYAGSCPKCRLLSAMIVACSLGRIRRESLDVPAWRRFYAEDLPQAHGYPVLFHRGRIVWGPRVFLATPLVTLQLAVRVISRAVAR